MKAGTIQLIITFVCLCLMFSNSEASSQASEELVAFIEAERNGQFPETTMTAAENGDADSQFMMGRYFQNIDSSFKSSTEALYWYQLAAKQNHMRAIREVAVFYSAGIGGVKRDCSQSIKMYQKLVDLGDPDEWHNLAWHLVTCEQPGIIDADKAMALFDENMTEYDLSIAHLDTLAAIHAAKGDFNKAITIQELVVGLMSKEPGHPDRIQKIKHRLYLYEKGKTWTGWSYERPELYEDQ